MYCWLYGSICRWNSCRKADKTDQKSTRSQKRPWSLSSRRVGDFCARHSSCVLPVLVYISIRLEVAVNQFSWFLFKVIDVAKKLQKSCIISKMSTLPERLLAVDTFVLRIFQNEAATNSFVRLISNTFCSYLRAAALGFLRNMHL